MMIYWNVGKVELLEMYVVKQLVVNEYVYMDLFIIFVEKCFDWGKELGDLVECYGREFYLVVFCFI